MKPVHLYKHDFQKWLMYSKGFRDLVGGVGLLIVVALKPCYFKANA